MASYYDDDERGPYIPFSVLHPPEKNHNDEEDYVPITQILKDFWREEREKLYCKSDTESILIHDFFNNYTYDEEDLWSDTSDEIDEDLPSSSDESSVQEISNDFDPLDNDPIFKEASKKFAYV